MAFVHCGSQECMKSELDLFQMPPTQTSIERSLYIEVPPLSALSETAPLEFFIAGSHSEYLDLSASLLYLTVKITKADGSDIPATAKVALVPYPIASLFNQLDVCLGDRLVSQSNNSYPYRAFLDCILNYSDQTLNSQFSAGMFYRDTGGFHESTDLDGDNEGFKNRARLTAQSKKVELMGRLHTDLFFQDRLLIPGLDLKIKLTRNRDAFCLMSGDVEDYKVAILSATLFMKRVTVTAGVRLAHAETLLLSNAKYPIERVGIKVFSIPAGSRVANQENLFLGQLPKTVVLAFVDNDAFSGSKRKSPYNFKHYNICFAGLYLEGVQVPSKPYTPDYTEGQVVREYTSLLQVMGKHALDRPVVVDREEYTKGYSLLAFDLTPDNESGGHYSLVKSGNLRAEVRFSAPLPATINLIIYSVFDNVIEVNQRREILIDYM